MIPAPLRSRVDALTASQRLFIATVAAFVVCGIVAILFVREQMREQALVEAANKAEIMLDRNMAIHQYLNGSLKPAVFPLAEEAIAEGYFEPRWMASTYAVREIDGIYRSLDPANAEYGYKEAAINARTPANEADPYERAFIQELNADPDLMFRAVIRDLGDEPYYQVLRRGEAMEAGCLRCHSDPALAPKGMVEIYGDRSFGRELGEVVSAISIQIPLAAAYAEADVFAGHLGGVFALCLRLSSGCKGWRPTASIPGRSRLFGTRRCS